MIEFEFDYPLEVGGKVQTNIEAIAQLGVDYDEISQGGNPFDILKVLTRTPGHRHFKEPVSAIDREVREWLRENRAEEMQELVDRVMGYEDRANV